MTGKKLKLLMPCQDMREELKAIKESWDDVEMAAGIPPGTIEKFVEKDEITDSLILKLDKLNRQ